MKQNNNKHQPLYEKRKRRRKPRWLRRKLKKNHVKCTEWPEEQRGVEGECAPTIPLEYNGVGSSHWHGARTGWTEWREQHNYMEGKEETAHVVCTEYPEDQRAVVAAPRMTEHLPSAANASSSMFSSPSQDIIPCTRFQGILPQVEVLCTESKHLSPPVSPQHTIPRVQSNDISSCSEVESRMSASQPRTKARKRRRITSKLSLSQNSAKHHRQPSQDDVQFLQKVIQHSINTSTTTTTSSSSSSSCSVNTNLTIQISNDSVNGKQKTSSGSLMQTCVEQPTKCLKQSVHTQSQSQSQTHTSNTRESLKRNITGPTTSLKHQRTNSDGVTCQKGVLSLQNPSSVALSLSPSPTQPQMCCFRRQEDLTLSSTSDALDTSVYHDAYSHLSFLQESRSGPSGRHTTPKCTAGQAPHPLRHKGQTDTSSSSSLRESDTTSQSFSSSGSNTFVAESVLNNYVVKHKQQASSSHHVRLKQELHHERACPTNPTQITTNLMEPNRGPEQWHTSLQPTPSYQTPPTLTSQGRSKPLHQLGKGAPHCHTHTHHPGKGEVSSSTSEYLSEEEQTTNHLQGATAAPVRPDWRHSSSEVSSSSCESSVDQLTQAGKGCIQTVGEVFKHYFGGTVSDNLTLLQTNNFNLVKCLLKLQTTSPSSEPCSTSSHHATPTPAPTKPTLTHASPPHQTHPDPP